jgi:hypothetical protein
MNDKQRNSIAMLETVRTYMNDNAAVWNGLPAAGVVVTELSGRVDDINETVQKQEDPTTGITQDKETLREILEDKIREVGPLIAAYAASVSNFTLLADVDANPSDVDKTSEQRIDDIATRIYNGGVANLAQLGPFNITQAKLDDLDQARQAFLAAKNKPRVKINEKAGETRTLPQMITEAKSLLRLQLDKLMASFRLSKPQFYAGYLSARVIIDRHGPGNNQPPEPPQP